MRIDLLIRLLRDRRGATAVEYGLIAALIAMSVMGAILSVGNSVGSNWDRVETSYSAAND